MPRVFGSSAAEALIRVGLGHEEVVRALIREVGISADEAEAAWVHVTGAAAAVLDETPP
jgi:hypothetical protein